VTSSGAVRSAQLGPWAVAAVAFLVGWIGMAQSPEPLSTADELYRTLQLFVLDGAALDKITPNGWLQVARFLAPFATVFALVIALRGRFDEERRRRRIARMTGHVIVCGEGPAALVLARNLVEDYRRQAAADGNRQVVLVGAAPPRVDDDGVLVVEGDAREPATLRAAGVAGARALFACDRSSAVNAAVALAAGTLRPDAGEARLATFAQVRSDDLVEALRVRRLASASPRDSPHVVKIDFFAVPDIAARAVVARHPPVSGDPTVLGSGPLARAVLWAIVRTQGGKGRTVHLAGMREGAVRAEAERVALGGFAWTLRAGAENDGNGLVYVCLADEGDDEDEAISAGLRIARLDTRDVVVCLQRDSPFRPALGEHGRMKIFGVLDVACRARAIEDDSVISRTARAIHENYRAEAARRHETETTNPSTTPWAELPQHLQASNIAQAEHIGTKLVEIKASVRTVPPPTPFAFSDEEVEQLAQAEHLRWMEEREDRGFRYGPRREGLFHPDLVDWSNLSDVAKEKDRAAVRNLPALLAAEGLYIWRNG
jgi:hypothetical protein